MTFTTIAAVGTALYFFGFGAGFLFRPELADRLGLRWTNPQVALRSAATTAPCPGRSAHT